MGTLVEYLAFVEKAVPLPVGGTRAPQGGALCERKSRRIYGKEDKDEAAFHPASEHSGASSPLGAEVLHEFQRLGFDGQEFRDGLVQIGGRYIFRQIAHQPARLGGIVRIVVQGHHRLAQGVARLHGRAGRQGQQAIGGAVHGEQGFIGLP